ncbi:cytochrome P450 [Aspergillus candidus]|uniref:Isotrichodermin C-15 hydroxylase n=1 Tax=Aspergillus candidus TaxID=41067 RepID=A0A2I2FKZ7_ASPCN|nr:isotrichodermin C-15 hydroxylase [Aspergillus candidus]PLB41274.1 isotrichodermin C-15 hydroxylase [Aspergillus candidus]
MITIWSVIVLLMGACLLHRIGLILYRIFFHPLANFPGPKLYAASYLPYLYQNKITGTLAKDMLGMHDRYGPIVRISPTQLAIEGSIGWSEVFSRRPNVPEFEKTPTFYGARDGIGILPAQHDDHRRQRRLMAYAFSTGALSEQESHLAHYADLLIQQLRKQTESGSPVDITRWLNYLTIDIISELAFADSFSCLDRTDFHPLATMIFNSMRAGARLSFFQHYPLLRPLGLLFNRDMHTRRQYYVMARAKAEKRIAQGVDHPRRDFMAYVLGNSKDGSRGMSHDEMVTNARTLIGAGSHTTASALAAFVFYLTQTPDVYARLASEIRSAFASQADITIKATAALPFLHVCLVETLRIHPPLAETPPRISPGWVVNGRYIPKGTSISVFQWATTHSPHSFTNPHLFAPQRWLPADDPQYDARYANDNLEASKPFATGPRDCLGKYLAYAEMRMVVSRLLWNFDVELVDGQMDWADRQRVYIVYEKGELMVRLKPYLRDAE